MRLEKMLGERRRRSLGSETQCLSAIGWMLLVLLARDSLAEEMSCCSSAAGSCRSVCSKLSLVSLGADSYARENATRVFSELCSSELVEFWNCINSTFKDVERNENWTGRSCCHHGRSPSCRASCATAGDRLDLVGSCRWSDESELDDCLDEREESDRCCASVTNATCRVYCRQLFRRPGKQSQHALKQYNSLGCFHQLPKCLKSVVEAKTSEDPKLFLHCCEQASNQNCLKTCWRALHTVPSIHDILDALEEPCGPVKPHLPLWSCFLNASPTKPQRLPLNVGKLACCSRATRRGCQSLCMRAFQTDWSAWQQLEATCLASNLENDLRRCLEDTEEACEMGCSGLSFCSKFNDRPTTLFRTCTATADESAKWEADHWLRGGVIAGLGVPVRAAPSCPAETLQAAACLLQLRPCESRLHETRLCREDCMELMTSCVDWSAVKDHNAATLCARLSPPKPDAPCVSIKPFLEDPREQNEPPPRIEEDVNLPCKNNPCPQGQICKVHPQERYNYVCLPGCLLGEMSKQLIPVGSWAQVPRYEQQDGQRYEKQGSYRVCQCTSSGILDRCRDLNRPAGNTCWVQRSVVAHRSTFYIDCNPCRCYEGEITCSRKSCSEPRLPSLPCGCLDHYVPVCGRLGATHASTCLAKCAGLLPNEVESNSCSARDPCAAGRKACPGGERCVRRPRVCLSTIHKPCRQHECVPVKCDHREDTKGPVCDTDNRQHPSLCSLVRSGGSLAYRGLCLRGCSLRGPVCGANGESYPSECAAWAEHVIVDYTGSCVAVGLVADVPKPRCGEAVVCPPLARANCMGATPPGACCPVCGGAARLFYSRKQLESIYDELPNDDSDKHAVTLEAMLEALSRQLQVTECSLRGSLTPEGDIFLVNQPTTRKPSELQLAACVAEMEKLVSRIDERSPRIATEVPLSALTRAEVAHSRVAIGAGWRVGGSWTILAGMALAVGIVAH